ncbi:DUF1659 domain-containing protein [Peptoniphilus catoniae]|uniref:DUF1659 domain-containing protein n=1 Tax=Peptoniphilus catoniae TaxID=1660341 RepID=UPI0010FE64DE|nr:DUF1659 domain-containing protein [Peptoniphilus catoniae]
MAYTDRLDKVTLKIGIVNGTNKNGETIVSYKSFKSVNPTCSSDVLAEGAKQIAALFPSQMADMKKVVEYSLING